MAAYATRSATKRRLAYSSPLRDEPCRFLLLVLLYAIQGVPIGMSMGSMPFLLKSKMSYTAVGIFSLAAYPYSFKLFWSPIVDSVYNESLGRRKSWILPMQLLSGIVMIAGSSWVEKWMDAADTITLTIYYFILVLLAATQDIAVDGWALTLLSKPYVSWASTCQSIGMNLGYFTSFTVFLALNDAEFCNQHFRKNGLVSDVGLVSLGSYLTFWGWFYIAVTLAIALFVSEDDGDDNYDTSSRSNGKKRNGNRKKKAAVSTMTTLRHAYTQLIDVVRLKPVQLLSVVLIVGRIGVLTVESAAPLKLLEKGVSREALAGLVLVEFPMELVSAFIAGRWAAASSPWKPWMLGYRVRLGLAAITTLVVYYFPANSSIKYIGDAPVFFIGLAMLGAATSFTSTLMFTSLGSIYNTVSDPEMGGAYLTLLNTIANIGVVVPKFFIYAAIDWLTRGLAMDGFYLLSWMSIGGGVVIMVWLHRVLPVIEAYPVSAWRASKRVKSVR